MPITGASGRVHGQIAYRDLQFFVRHSLSLELSAIWIRGMLYCLKVLEDGCRAFRKRIQALSPQCDGWNEVPDV